MKRRLSLLLAILMLISVMCVAPVSVSAEGAYTVYCINSAKWDTVCAYAWGDTAMEWPGEAMTKTEDTVNGFDVYAYTTDTAYANVIFNNNDNGSQTSDLTWTNGQYYDVKADTWYASLQDVPVVDATATDVYIAGEMNSWSTVADEFKFGAEGGTVAYLTLTLEAETTYQFKVVNSGAWTSTTTAITDTVRGVAFSSSVGDNATITTTFAGDYLFAWDTAASTLSVEYPVAVDPTEAPVVTDPVETTQAPTDATEAPTDATEAPAETDPVETATAADDTDPTEAATETPADTYTIYCIAGDNWTHANAYMWNSNTDKASNWPGIAMTKTELTYDGRDVYEYTSDTEWANVIFNNGSEQTDDLIFMAGQYYDIVNAVWLESLDSTVDPTEAPDSTGDEEPTDSTEPDASVPDVSVPAVDCITVYFQNNWLWSDVYCYYEGSASAECDPLPGTPMVLFGNDGNYDVYSCQIPADATGIKISGIKDDGSGDRDFTPDITEIADGRCFYMLWENGNSFGFVDINVILPEPEAPLAEVAGYSLSLTDNISVNFFLKLSASVLADADAKVVFTYADTTCEVAVADGVYDEATGSYKFTCKVSAKDMATDINCKVASGNDESDTFTQSVKGYAEVILADADTYAKELALVKEMPNYGAAAQTYFGYNTDNLANDTEYMTDDDRRVNPTGFDGFEYTLSGEEAGVTYYGTALSLKSELAIKHYFIIDESVDVDSLYIDSNFDTEITKNGNLYEVKLSGIPAHMIGDNTELYLGGLVLNYNPFCYGKYAQNSGNAELWTVINALYDYYAQSLVYYYA